MNLFEEQYHFPQMVVAIDRCHIEIKAPPEDYYNRKQFYSIMLQAIVDSDLLFRHITAVYPGSLPDSSILSLSRVKDLADKREILTSPVKTIQGEDVRPMLVGDSAYPLSNWLIKLFSDRRNLLRHKNRFNRKLSSLRAVVERVFGLLKGQ